ncbi:MAG: chromate transporter, partial [Massilia sp.]|nr:chromate transporter [Massilia sp.]
TLIAIAIAAFAAIAILKLPFPLIVLGAALIGFIGGRYAPSRFQIGGGHPDKKESYGLAIIDDDTPTPAHARFSWRKLAVVAVAGCVIGAATWLALPPGTLSDMGWFFTKAALMTFGGAYAVLPYVYQGGVEHFHWLTPTQMIDGLALGETTPGPLIMIVAFVGFVGGWHQGLAAVGACVATFFTFLPSFIFILAGGPLVERTRDNVRMTAPLTAISAAVVGVIVSLAVFFGQHVFFTSAGIDVKAIAISAAACIALFRFQVGPIKLIFACALAGLVLSYWHG